MSKTLIKKIKNSNYQKLSQNLCSKAGKNKTKPASSPKPCAFPWEEATKKKRASTKPLRRSNKKRPSTKSNISSSSLPYNYKRIPTNGYGTSPQDWDTDIPRAESNYLWLGPGGYFFYSFHLFGDLQGLSHQLIAMELNHMAIKPDKSLILHFLHFQTWPQKAEFLGL